MDIGNRQAGDLAEFFLNPGTQRMRFDLCPDGPGDWSDPDIQSIDGIRNLCLRGVHPRLRIVIQSAVAHVADDAHDLAFRFVLEFPHHAPPDNETCIERIITPDPILFGHGLVNDDDCRCSAIIPIGERTTALDGNFEDIEIAGGDGQPPASAMERPLPQRPARNDEWETIAALQRDTTRCGGTDNAGYGANTFHTFANDLLDNRGLQKSRSRQRHPHGQNVRRVEAGLDGTQRNLRANEQCRSHEQNHSERNLGDDQQRANLVMSKAGARASAALFETRIQVGARTLKRGNQAKQDSCPERDKHGKTDDPPVQAHHHAVFSNPGKTRGVDRQQRSNAQNTEDQSQGTSGQRQQNALRQQLAHDPSPACAHGRSDGNLAFSAGSADQQKVRDIRARDQQNEADGAEQDHKRLPHITYKGLLERLDAKTIGWTNTVRELAPKLLAGCLELCLGLLQCDPGFQPARRLKVMALIAGVRIELERHKDFGCRTEFTDIESRANDSNHNIGITAQGNGLTYDSRIARETSGPQTVADQGNLFTIGKILFFAECAASQNGRAEEFEIIGGYLPRPELLDKLAPRIVHDTNPESGAIFHGGLAQPVLEFRR